MTAEAKLFLRFRQASCTHSSALTSLHPMYLLACCPNRKSGRRKAAQNTAILCKRSHLLAKVASKAGLLLEISSEKRWGACPSEGHLGKGPRCTKTSVLLYRLITGNQLWYWAALL
jgi:hypothetical protein